MLIVLVMAASCAAYMYSLAMRRNAACKPTNPTKKWHKKPSWQETSNKIESDTGILQSRQEEKQEIIEIQPEIQRLQQLVNEFAVNNAKWDNIIAVGDIYRKGAFPRFIPNEDMALRCYKLAAMCPDGMTAGIAQSKYIETRDEPINDVDKKGVPFPTEYGNHICLLVESAIISTPYHMFEKPKRIKDENYFFHSSPALPKVSRTFSQVVQSAARKNPAYRSDAQNVHDHGITSVTNHNILKLKETTNTRGMYNDVTEQVRHNILEGEVSENTKLDALNVLDNLKDHVHSTFNVSEKDALAMVWDRINKQPSAEIKRNLKDTLITQLASGMEKGHVVCSSGKITRILSTLDGVENEQTARPMWVIKDEFANLASKIRDKYSDLKLMQDAFTKEVNTEYVEKLGMSTKIIQPLIDEYLVGFA